MAMFCCLLPCLYFLFYLYTGNTLLVNRSMPPQATAKDTSPAPPPKGPFAPFWETGGSFAAMVLVLSCSLGWRPPLPRWRQHSWVCPHTAMAAVHSLPYAHKGTESGVKALVEDVEPPQEAGLPVRAWSYPLWQKTIHISCLLGLRCSDTHVAPFLSVSERIQASPWLPHPGAEQPFSHISSSSRLMFRRKYLHKAKYKAALRIDGGFQVHSLLARGMKTARAFIVFPHLRQDAFLG